MAGVAIACIGVAGVSNEGAPAHAVTGQGLVVVGEMPFGRPWSAVPPPGLIVDDVLHQGFVLDMADGTVAQYDLEAMRLQRRVPIPDHIRFRGNDGRQFAAVDSARHRIFWTLSTQLSVGTCNVSPIAVLDTVKMTWQVRELPCTPPPVEDAFVINGLSYDEATDRLHLVGMYQSTNLVYGTGMQLPKQPTLYAQVNPDSFEIDWLVDASAVCDWHNNGQHAATVGAGGDRLVGFCHQGGRSFGARGAALSVPVSDGHPEVVNGQARTEVNPTYSDPGVLRLIDPVTGRLLLISGALPFGPAVWVYDTKNAWFTGVTPTGVDPNAAERFDYGFDVRSGRLYVHSSRGVVVVDTRHTPLPGGVTYEVDQDVRAEGATADVMAVDGGLRRIFRVDPKGKRWIVIEDRTPVTPPDVERDPDLGTADVPEEAGKTDRTYTAGGNAYGAHFLNVGGIPAAIHSYDLREDCFHRFFMNNAPCLVPLIVSPGNREYFLGHTSASVGESSGAGAFASAGRSAPRDYATDADARSLGKCYADRVETMFSAARKPMDDGCTAAAPLAELLAVGPLQGFTFENLRRGTAPRARPEDDFPVPSSACGDEGAHADDPDPEDRPQPVARSDVRCIAKDGKAYGDAWLRTVSFEASGFPTIGVAGASSRVETRLDPERGVVTRAEATAEGVVIGDIVKIGRVHTVAETSAKGRTGTTRAQFLREVSDVVMPGFSCATTCDPAQVADGITKAFGGLVQARVRDPLKLATPRGHTGLVAKDPGLVASDAAINDDDSVAASGLDLIVIHDYSKGSGADGQNNSGRSRFILSLAGVQAESHYGVFPVPVSGAGTGGVFIDEVDAGRAAIAGEDRFLPGIVTPPSTPARHRPGGVTVAPGTRFPTLDKAIRLVVNNPAQAALVAMLLGLLAAPIYVAIRRRLVAAVWQA